MGVRSRRSREPRRRSRSVPLLVAVALAGALAAWPAHAAQELRLGWITVSPPPGAIGPGAVPPPSAVMLLGRQRVPGPVPRQRDRDRELAPDRVVVVAEDGQGQIRDWQVVADPRILRAEGPGPSGELTGQVVVVPDGELMLTIPDDPAITLLRLYRARWTGTDFVLDLLGSVPLP